MTATDDLVDELLSGSSPDQPPATPEAVPQERGVADDLVDELLAGPKTAEEPAEPQGPERNLFERAARFLGDWNLSVAQGATSKYSDELAAYVGSKIGLGDYDELIEKVRARHEEIPASVAIPGEIAGGIGTTAALSALPGGQALGATRLGQLASKAPGWLKAMGFGGLFGGAYGSGAAEGGLEERLPAAAWGAGAGAITAGALQPVGSLVRKGAGAAAAQIRARVSPEREALAQIRRAFARDEITPGKLRSRLRELGPQATIADAAGENTRTLIQMAAGTPGPARNRVKQILNQRAEGEGARIIRALNRGVDFDDFYAAEEAFLKNLREQAAPLYQQAYEKHQSIMTPALNRVIRGKVGRDAMKEAAALFEIERAAGRSKFLGAVDKELTEALRSARDVGKTPGIGPVQPGVIKGFSLETWDQIKRGLDSLLDNPSYRNQLTDRLNAKGSAVYALKKTLVKELDKATGGNKSLYAQARKIYSGDAEVLDALREGRKALNKDPEIITREIGELSNAAREAYKSGAARALRDVVDKTGDTASAARRIFGNARSRSRLRALFPGEDYNRLAKTLVAEQQFAGTKNTVLSGSQTREKLAAEKDFLTKGAGVGALMMSSGGEFALAAIRRKAAEAIFGPQNEKFLADIAKKLVNRNPAMNQQALDKIFGRLGMTNAPLKAKQEAATYLIPLIIGQQTGRASGAQHQSGQ